jgi:hypothetical protein
MLTLPPPVSVDTETLTATTLPADVRIAKTEAVAEPLSNEVYLGAFK